MSNMPGNVNKQRHEDIVKHPETGAGVEYEHADFPVTVYHKSKKAATDDVFTLSKVVRNAEELAAARAEGYFPLKGSLQEAEAAPKAE